MRDIEVTSPTLHAKGLDTLAMCRFTGERLGFGAPCPTRTARHHPDVDCWAVFVLDPQETARRLDMLTR